MKYTTKYINKQIMLALYILMSISGVVALFITQNPSVKSTIPQVFTLLISIIFLIFIIFKDLNQITHVVSIAFYIITTISMWFFLGSAHPLGLIYLMLLIIIIIETLDWKVQRLLLVVLILTYMIFGLVDVFIRIDNPSLHIFTLPGFIGISVLIIGVAIITLLSRLFKEELLKHLRDVSSIDALTGVKNTRAFYEEIELLESDYLRYQTNYSLVYVDVDEFKEINDQYGHLVGDEVLKNLSQHIKKSIRKTDEVYRLGGDEFVVTFKNVGKSEVQKKMIIIGEEYSEHNRIHLGFSYGIIERKGSELSVSELLKEADRLMYENKQTKKHSSIKKIK